VGSGSPSGHAGRLVHGVFRETRRLYPHPPVPSPIALPSPGRGGEKHLLRPHPRALPWAKIERTFGPKAPTAHSGPTGRLNLAQGNALGRLSQPPPSQGGGTVPDAYVRPSFRVRTRPIPASGRCGCATGRAGSSPGRSGRTSGRLQRTPGREERAPGRCGRAFPPSGSTPGLSG
jgi:hypothetical protein